jgi:hypothetical protein
LRIEVVGSRIIYGRYLGPASADRLQTHFPDRDVYLWQDGRPQ